MRAAARHGAAVALVAASLAPAGARATEPTSLARWFDRMQARLDELVAEARPTPAVLEPPVPIDVRWSMKPIGELGSAAVLALDALDVDGDGADELLVLTGEELRVLRLRDGALAATLAFPLGGPVATLRPRVPVGTLVIGAAVGPDAGDRDAPRLVARSSERAWAQAFDVVDGRLAPRAPGGAGFPLCPDLAGRLVPGRYYFDGTAARWATAAPRPPLPGRFLAARCFVGPDDTGVPRGHFATVDADGLLSLYALDDPAAIPVYIENVGYAVELADVDTDGRLNVVAASASPPGTPDRVSVFEVTGGEVLRVFESGPIDGGVVATAVGNFAGDGRPVAVIAVRPRSGDPAILWSLN